MSDSDDESLTQDVYIPKQFRNSKKDMSEGSTNSNALRNRLSSKLVSESSQPRGLSFDVMYMPRFSTTSSRPDFAHNRDAADVVNEEVQKGLNQERKRKRSWQTFIFIVAAIKYYALSCTVDTTLVYSVV